MLVSAANYKVASHINYGSLGSISQNVYLGTVPEDELFEFH